MDLAQKSNELDELRLAYRHVERNNCQLKLDLAETQSQLDDFLMDSIRDLDEEDGANPQQQQQQQQNINQIVACATESIFSGYLWRREDP